MKKPANSIQVVFSTRLRKDKAYRISVLLELYSAQTDDERAAEMTKWYNEAGFNTVDAPVLTPLAEKVLDGEKLSRKEEAQLLVRLPKYWSQFVQSTLVNLPSVATALMRKGGRSIGGPSVALGIGKVA